MKKHVKFLLKPETKNTYILLFLYAHYIFHGDGPYIKDYDIGQEMLERARRLGSVDACNELGYLYCQGHEGISKNYGKGMDCFKEAAEMGNVEGIFNLATCYFNKEEQFYDFSLAKLWYARAAGKGDKLSIMMLDKIEKRVCNFKKQIVICNKIKIGGLKCQRI